MWRFLSRDPNNVPLIQKKQEHFETLKKVQTVLNQADRKNASTYNSLPYKFETLQKKIPAHQIDGFLKEVEIKMVANATMEDIVKQLELDLEADIVQSVTKKKTIILAEKVAGKQRIS